MLLSMRRRFWFAAVVSWLAAFLVFSSVALVSAPAFAADKPSKKSSGKSLIAVSSMTKGAKVFIDDKEVGDVPLPGPVEVEPNERHTIRVQKRGYTPYIDTVLPSPGQTVEVEADLVATGGFVKINSKDKGLSLQILIDGQIVGTTPFDGDVAPGTHAVEARAAGYLAQTQTIDVKAGQTSALEFGLKLVPPPDIKEDKSILSRWWFWTAIGVAVVGGVSSSVLLSQDTHVQPKAASYVLVLGN